MMMMMIYTLPASPPKAAMLSCTHCKAADWSQSPALPGASSIPSVRKPDGPTLPLRNWSILCSTMKYFHRPFCHYIQKMTFIPIVDRHHYDIVGHPEVRPIPLQKKKAPLFIVDKHLFTVAFTRVHHLLEKPLLSAKPKSNILYWK